jgi:hypothetical protein
VYERFAAEYRPDPGASAPSVPAQPPEWVTGAAEFESFMSAAAFGSFDHGLLRFVHAAGTPNAEDANGPAGWLADWANARGRLWVFAYDWLGRLYGFDRTTGTAAGPGISRLDPGSGAVEVTGVPFADFTSTLLVDQRDDVLATEFFEDWRSHGGRDLGPSECVGFRIPPFLGGTDELTNLEAISMSVYLSLHGQLLSQTDHLAPGTTVGGVKLSE